MADFQNVQSSSGRIERRKNTSLWMVFQVRMQCHLCSRCWKLGDLSTSKTDESADWMRELVLENWRICIHEVANMLVILLVSVKSILKESLNKCQIAAKFMVILLCLWKNFWLKTKCHSMSSLLTRFSTVWCVSFPKTQGSVKGKEI